MRAFRVSRVAAVPPLLLLLLAHCNLFLLPLLASAPGACHGRWSARLLPAHAAGRLARRLRPTAPALSHATRTCAPAEPACARAASSPVMAVVHPSTPSHHSSQRRPPPTPKSACPRPPEASQPNHRRSPTPDHRRSTTTTAAARCSRCRRLSDRPQPQPSPPTGSPRRPHAPPPLPRRQQALPWPESPFPFLPCFKIATRDLVRQLKQVQGPICTTVDSYE